MHVLSTHALFSLRGKFENALSRVPLGDICFAIETKVVARHIEQLVVEEFYFSKSSSARLLIALVTRNCYRNWVHLSISYCVLTVIRWQNYIWSLNCQWTYAIGSLMLYYFTTSLVTFANVDIEN